MEETKKLLSDQSENKNCIQKPTSAVKKKKERENRNCGSYDLIHDWNQNGSKVTVTVQVGPGHDKNSVDVSYDEKQLSVELHDGRKFQVELFDSILPQETKVDFKSHSCIVFLKKADQHEWESLEASKIASSARASIAKQKAAASPLPTILFSPPTSLPSPLDKAEPEPLERHFDNQEVEFDPFEEEENLIDVVNPKTNFCEHAGDRQMEVFLYIRTIIKETLVVHFCEDRVVVRFSSGDSSFLQNYSNANKESRFRWSLSLKGRIIPDQCNYKLSQANLEIKLKKKDIQMWSTLSPTMNPNSEVAKNIWVSAGSTNGELRTENGIPPAPPAPPPFPEARKPTSLVSPLKQGSNLKLGPSTSFHLSSIGDHNGAIGITNRGMTGLENIGNTCFMNSVLQCLINTRELREYFETDFEEDINKDNPLGMGGKLAMCFSSLMDLAWKGSNRSYAPNKLKNIMSLKANQFSGYAQHDAQEFMVELLDGLHEDLNRIKKKPYIAEPPDLDGYPDSEAADASWKLHKNRNDSIIDDLFKGQFKSTLKCHTCSKISVKFDEFCCLSVPIPKDQKLIQVVFFWVDQRKPKKYRMRLPAEASAEDLKYQLSIRTGIKSSCIQIIEVARSKIQKVFTKGSSLSNVGVSDDLMAFEILDENKCDGPVLELTVTQRMLTPSQPKQCAYCSRLTTTGKKLKRCTKCYRAGYCDTSCQKNHWPHHKNQCRLVPELVGTPFIISLPESRATYANLSSIAQSYSHYSVDIFQPPVSQTQIAQRCRRRRRRGSNSSGEASSDAEDMEVDEDRIGDCEMDGSEAYSGEDRAEADWPFTCNINSDLNSASNLHGDQANRSIRPRRSSSISSTSSGGEDIPQLSSSPGLRNTPQKTLCPAPKLFTLRPVTSRLQNLTAPAGDPLVDKGDDPLYLGDVHHLIMEWETNEKRPAFCLVQNKEIDCDIDEEEYIQRSKHTTLEACIDLFTQPENLSDGDLWRCPRCKKPVEATKQMSVWRLPTNLIIQLKRFSFKYILCSDKIDKFVQYPVRSLDVRPFMSREPTDGSSTIYDLYGVINHMGRLLGGHYNAFCRTVDLEDTTKSEIDWRLCDDSRVSFVNESRIVHDQAYLLLYRRRNFHQTFPLHRPLAPPDESRNEVMDDCPQAEVDKETGAEAPEPMDSTSQDERRDNFFHEANSDDDSPSSTGIDLPEPMKGATPMSISSISQFSSGSDPPSTVQEELD